ncbi:lysylphosphatidylglycerol synthase transmembrane domain-containing protein [Shimia ponticola]|uniref:lysylphosphatidylglycerol synthase transmembrane domain-containing protein n=1 Tax=Shimia ponticola TaxID=2582893 RepID=UPI0021058D62|nr:lysylphosphatidylglycerol synthase transmembrane domain-containing protein [Shimia ponticola]
MSSINPSRRENRAWMDTALVGGLVAVVIVGLVALAHTTSWTEIWAQIQKLSSTSVAILLLLSIANYGMRAVRWHLFTRRLGLPTSLAANMRHYLGGFAMSVTPGRVGELIRIRWLLRETDWGVERTAPLALVDRAADLAAMALILGLALLLSAGGMAFALPFAGIALAIAILATQPKLLSALVTLLFRATGIFPRLMGRVRRAARSLRLFMTPKVLTLAGALSMLGWLAEGYAFYLLLNWMGAPLPFWMAVAVFTFATLAGGLTGAPGGLGGAEAAMVALLSLEGVPLEVSIPATAIIRLTTLWFAIAIGLAAFPIAEKYARRT